MICPSFIVGRGWGFGCYPSRRGVTLVEVLVVMGIIAILSGIMIPVVGTVRRNARAVQCGSNLRQLSAALYQYASDSEGRFPPNTTAPPPAMYWSDPDRIGRYLPLPIANSGQSTIFACPEDDGMISYSMNLWASSKVNLSAINAVKASGSPAPTLATDNSGHASEIILLTESWSGQGSDSAGWMTTPTIGQMGSSEGARFGGGSGIPLYRAGRIGIVNCELSYIRHRITSVSGAPYQPRGRVNIAFLDGHVELCDQEMLVNNETGISSGKAIFFLQDPP